MSGSMAQQPVPQQIAPGVKAVTAGREKMPPISPQVLSGLAQRAQAQGQPDQALIIQAAAAQQAGKSLSPQQQQQVLQAMARQQQQHGTPMQALTNNAKAVQAGKPGAGPIPQGGPPPAQPPQGGGQQIPPAMLQAMMQRAGVPGAPSSPQGAGQGQPPSQGQAAPPGPAQPQFPPAGSMPPNMPTFVPPQPGSPPPSIPPRMAPPGSPQQRPSQGAPGLSPFARVAQQGMNATLPVQAPSGSRLTPAEQARLGRNGDSIIAHLSPGEITIPREMQSPQMLQMIAHHARAVGANPAMMQAGNPMASRNPHTGNEEHSFLGTVLPIVAMAAVAIALPELAPALVAYAPLIVGATGAATSLATGSSVEGALITGAGGAAGAYFGGAGSALASSTDAAGDAAGSSAAEAASAAPGASADTINSTAALTANNALPTPPIAPVTADAATGVGTPAATAAGDAATGTGAPAASAAAPAQTNVAQAVGNKVEGTVANKATTSGLTSLANMYHNAGQTQLGFNYPTNTTQNADGSTTTTGGNPATLSPALGAAVGGGLGAILAGGLQQPTSLSNSSALPANFNAPSQGKVIGMGAQQPTFVGYNPYTSVTGQGGAAGYNFFPTPAVAS